MKKILFALTIMLSQTNVFASSANTTTASAKPARTWGTFVALGNPYPSLLGVNASYNITPDLRASVGYGEVEVTTSIDFSGGAFVENTTKAETYSVGVDYLFMNSSFRPLIGAHIGYFSISGDGDFDIQGFTESTGLIYTKAGIEWIAQDGLYIGSGLNLALVGSSSSGFYANFGYFF